jgi:hypothetical protein
VRLGLAGGTAACGQANQSPAAPRRRLCNATGVRSTFDSCRGARSDADGGHGPEADYQIARVRKRRYSVLEGAR